jgi:cystine transport system substrate-binding protein
MTPELAERFDTSTAYSQPDAQLLARKDDSQRPMVMAQSFQPEEKSGPPPSLVIPFQKGNPAFKASLDNALARIKDDGRLEQLSQKWLVKQE